MRNKFIGILIVVFGLALGIAGFVIYRVRNRNGRNRQGLFDDLRGDGLGASRSGSRNFSFLTGGSWNANLLASNFNSGKLVTNGKFAPWLATAAGEFNASSRSINKKNIKWQIDTFDYYVRPLAKSFNLPRCLIYMVMANETSSQAQKANYNKEKYIELCNASRNGDGPMQMTAIVSTETLQIAEVKGLIDDYHIDIVKDSVGNATISKIFQKRNEKLNSKNNFVDNKVLSGKQIQDAELNILLGITLIANLIDDFGENELHQVVYSYSRGNNQIRAYGYSDWTASDFINRKGSAKQAAQLGSGYHKIGVDYIQKCLGKDGTLDIIINDLAVID